MHCATAPLDNFCVPRRDRGDSSGHDGVRNATQRATLIAEKVDTAGRHVRQIELCPLRCQIVIERERSRGLEICDRRNE